MASFDLKNPQQLVAEFLRKNKTTKVTTFGDGAKGQSCHVILSIIERTKGYSRIVQKLYSILKLCSSCGASDYANEFMNLEEGKHTCVYIRSRVQKVPA